MKQFSRDYGTVAFILTLLFMSCTALGAILARPFFDLLSLLVCCLFGVFISILMLLLNRSFSLSLEGDVLIIKYFSQKALRIERDQVAGLVYNFHHASGNRISWRELRIICRDGRCFVTRRWDFFDPVSLEKELRKKYKVLVPATGNEITGEALKNLDKELEYFDRRSLNRCILWGWR